MSPVESGGAFILFFSWILEMDLRSQRRSVQRWKFLQDRALTLFVELGSNRAYIINEI